MSVHLVNPSDNSFGTAVITPRWLFVLAAATPQAAGDPILVDELRKTFLVDLAYCRKIELSDWRRRGLWQEAKEQVASLLEDQV